MSCLITWPNFYTKDTYVSFDWDLHDLSEKLETVLDNYSDYIELAENAQNIYKHYVASEEGNDEFISRSPNDVETINATEGGSLFGKRIKYTTFENFLQKYT